MAHKKGVGSTDNGRDSQSKRLGVKLYGSEIALAGNILVRQRGTKFHPGRNVYMGKDFTLHAGIDGMVSFVKKRNNRTYVEVLPVEEVAAARAQKAPKKAAPVEKATSPGAPQAEKEAQKAAPKPEKEEKPKAKAAPAKEEKAPAKKEKPKAKAKASEKITLPSGKKVKQDDLKIVEGVGPKIEGLLQDAGINTWAEFAAAGVDKLQAILDEAGPRYKMHDPETWSKQAKLAAEAKWEELEALQDELKGGRKV